MAAPVKNMLSAASDTNSGESPMETGDFTRYRTEKDVYSNLDQFWKKLLCNETPSDDTFFQKVSTLIEYHVDSCQNSNARELYDPGSYDPFSVSGIIKNTSLKESFTLCSSSCDQPDTLAFLLRTAGLVGCVEYDEVKEEIAILFTSTLKRAVWEEASVRHGWLEGLSKLACNKAGLTWIFQKGLEKTALACLQDSSLYVSETAGDTISKLVTSGQKLCVGFGDTSESNSCIKMLTFVMTGFGKCRNDDCCDLPHSLRILSQTCKNEDLALLCCNEFSLSAAIQNELFRCTNDRDITSLCDLASLLPRSLTGLEREDLPIILLRKGLLRTAITVAGRYMEKTSSTKRDLIILLSPLLVCSKTLQTQIDKESESLLYSYFSTKSSHIKTIYLSLGLLKSLNMDPEAVNRCVIMLIEILGLCRNTTTDINSENMTEFGERIIHNSKIKSSLLELFEYISNKDIPEHREELLQAVVSLSADLLATPYIPQTVIARCYSSILCVMKLCQCSKTKVFAKDDSQNFVSLYLGPLKRIMQKKLCDMEWESRDTTLEFLGNLSILNTSEVTGWLIEEGYPRLVWQCVEDGEGYVRASALATIRHMSSVPELWENLTEQITQEKMFTKVTCILKDDLEAFTRRASVDLLQGWTDLNLMPARSHEIEQAMKDSVQDYDWEVKIRAIRFWERFTRLNSNGDENALPPSLELLDEFCDVGASDVILASIKDPDRSVQKKSCEFLLKIRDFLQESEDTPGLSKRCASLLSTIIRLELDHLLLRFSSSIDVHRNVSVFLHDVLASMKPPPEPVSIEDDGTEVSVDCY